MIKLENNYPATIEAAVELLKSKLSMDTLEHIRRMEENTLIIFHYGIGTTVRNQLGLSDGTNTRLMQDIGAKHPDDASAVIIWHLWKKLQE